MLLSNNGLVGVGVGGGGATLFVRTGSTIHLIDHMNDECISEFRFKKTDVLRVVEAMDFPDIRTPNRLVILVSGSSLYSSSEDGLSMSL